jgi:MscS family membrane protein
MMDAAFFDQVYLGNTVRDYAITAGIILVGLVIMKLVSRFLAEIIYRIFKRHAAGTTVDELFGLLSRPVSFFFVLCLAYMSIRNLSFPASWNLNDKSEFGILMVLHKGYMLVITGSIVWMLLRLIDYIALILFRRAERTASRSDDQLVPFIRDMLKIIATVMMFFFMLGAVFDVNVAAIIGGLGIGGLALALAGKETVENLFGSITIFLDKPFVVGDQVNIENVQGHVEKIGLRSTRIRTLEKSLISVPNKKMINADVENITERTYWRARYTIQLVYSTQPGDLQNIITAIKHYLDYHDDIESGGTVALDKFNESSIDVLIVYLVKTNEMEKYVAVKEMVNFRILEIVRENNTSFAYPTRSIITDRPPAS